MLNTLQHEFYYLYNQNDKTSAIGWNGIYSAWFPWVRAGLQYTFNQASPAGNKTRYYDQLDTWLGLTLPFSYAKSKSFRNFSVSSYYVRRNEFNKGFFKDSLGTHSFSYLQHSLSLGSQSQMAAQHLFPHLGYALSATVRHAITKYTGYQLISKAAVYLPGILATHSLVLTGSFQQRDTLGQIVFSDQFDYSRGYTGRYFSRMWRISGNYHLPLFYPDWGFGNILYLQRVRMNAFADYTLVYSRDKLSTRPQKSVGAEFYIDTKWWNQYPLSFGIRISHLLDPDQFNGAKGTYLEFVMPVSIIPR